MELALGIAAQNQPSHPQSVPSGVSSEKKQQVHTLEKKHK